MGGRQIGGSVAAVLLRCPGCGGLAAGLRRLLWRPRVETAFRDEVDAVARGQSDPDLRNMKDAPEDVKLALRVMEDVRD